MEPLGPDSIFYHVYPLGLCGAPTRNDFSAAPVERLDKLYGWLGHILDLGANALYLGPLFESSAHGYDTADYWHVDRRLGTDATLVWSAVNNRTYRVQYKADLNDPSWTDVPGDVTASGATASKTDTGAADAQRFYRVHVVSP